MRIRESAIHAGVNAQTLRYYGYGRLVGGESTDGGSGYSEHDPTIRQVRSIRRARDLAFTLDEIGDVLGLWADSSKSCSVVETRVGLSPSSLAPAMSVIGRARRTGVCLG
jgi:DNA-binding transcriptional MerR regulator